MKKMTIRLQTISGVNSFDKERQFGRLMNKVTVFRSRKGTTHEENAMFCMSCGHKVLESARFCPSCGSAISPLEGSAGVQVRHKDLSGNEIRSTPLLAGVKPTTNCEFRQKLLDSYLSIVSSQELSEWLEDIVQDSKGTAEEMKGRARSALGGLTGDTP